MTQKAALLLLRSQQIPTKARQEPKPDKPSSKMTDIQVSRADPIDKAGERDACNGA